MTTFQDLQAEHEALLKRHAASENTDQFWADVQHFIEQVRIAAEDIGAPRERDQLRAILRFWASYVYDRTGAYPDTSLRPATNVPTATLPQEPEGGAPGTKPSESAPPHHTPMLVWAIAILAVIAVAIALLSLLTSNGRGTAVPVNFTPGAPASSTDLVATEVHFQMQVNATLTSVAEASATPTHPPTPTPTNTSTSTATPTPLPTETPEPTFTPTPTPIMIRPEVPITASPENLPLDVGYQPLTQGPSPFDATEWVMQLRLVGSGGNGVYIYWVDGQQLPGADYTVHGQSCEPQALSIGVTSRGEAVKHDITLLSPLLGCLTPTPFVK